MNSPWLWDVWGEKSSSSLLKPTTKMDKKSRDSVMHSCFLGWQPDKNKGPFEKKGYVENSENVLRGLCAKPESLPFNNPWPYKGHSSSAIQRLHCTVPVFHPWPLKRKNRGSVVGPFTELIYGPPRAVAWGYQISSKDVTCLYEVTHCNIDKLVPLPSQH